MTGTTRHEPDRFAWLFTGWRGIAVGLVAALAIAITGANAIDSLRLVGAYGANGLGTRGFTSENLPENPGVERITGVAKGGVADRAGLRPGALVRLDRPFEAHALLQAGRAIGLTIEPDGAAAKSQKPRHVIITTSPMRFADLSPVEQVSGWTTVLQLWLGLSIGILALARGWGRLSSVAFGIGMLGWVVTIAVPSWATGPAAAAAMLFGAAVVSFADAGIFLFPAVLYAERVGPPSRRWIPAFVLVGLSCVPVFGLQAWFEFHDASYELVANQRTGSPLLLLLLDAHALYWSRRGGRDATGADRQRFATIFYGYAFGIAYSVLEIAFGAGLGDQLPALSPVLAAALTLIGGLLNPLVLAYVALRSRVIDIDFALNRTVVYGVFSAILLGGFGFVEWGFEHLLPEEYVKASAWIDAGAAVLVYLAFHRVHDAVEHRVEHLFFGKWQANEDALRRFVGSAAHFEDEHALARGFADELVRFGGEARVAVYRRNEGVLDRVAGNWDSAPRHFREDNPAFALMRAERAPLDLTETRTGLPGVLALPMLDHGALAGLVLMDLKNDEALYRPDEVALLGWAAHEVGIALTALQSAQMASDLRAARTQVAQLSAILSERQAITAPGY